MLELKTRQTKHHNNLIIVFCVGVFCLHVCLYSTCMPGVLEGQKRMLDPLELVSAIMWLLESNLGPLEEEVLLITEPFLLFPLMLGF